jgi:hypothetical protein
MSNDELLERLSLVIEFLNEDNREAADGELYAIFDDLEFISEDYEDEDIDDVDEE